MKKLLIILLLFLSVAVSGQTGFFWSYSRVFRNVQLCDYFTKNNCASGEIGVSHQACISEGQFVSGISQADADAKAHEMLYHTVYSGVTGWGQYVTNLYDTCTIDYHSYSYLYNWYVVANAKKITSSDSWIVPSSSDATTLMNSMGGSSAAGANGKMVGYTYWNNTNTGATNAYGFNFVGAGFIMAQNGSSASFYTDYLLTGSFWSSDTQYYNGVYYPYVTSAIATYNDLYIQTTYPYTGSNIRFLKTSTSKTAGQTGTYTGNDGKVYPTIAIGSPAQEWTAMDLAETKYRDGTIIPSKIGLAFTQDVTGARWDTTKIAYNPNYEAPPPATAPTVTTTAITAITSTTATSGGNATTDGGASVTARGVCWGTSANPTTAGSHTTDGTNTGTFVSSITGLSANTTYHVRAYATNSVGTSYGDDVSFTTNPGIYVTLNALYNSGLRLYYNFTVTNNTGSTYSPDFRYRNTTISSIWITVYMSSLYAYSSSNHTGFHEQYEQGGTTWVSGDAFELQFRIDGVNWITTNIVAPGSHVLNYP